MEDDRWSSRPDGTAVLIEYRAALDVCCIAPDVLRDSVTANALRRLHDAPHFLGKFRGDVVEEAVNAAQSFHLLGQCRTFHDSCTSWERQYLAAALSILTQPVLLARNTATAAAAAAAKDTLRLNLQLLAESSGQCASRRRTTFGTIVLHAGDALGGGDLSAEALGNGGGATQRGIPCGAVIAQGADVRVAEAASRLRAQCAAAAHDLKDRAFRQVFVEPTRFYAAVVGDAVLGDDADVHGGCVHAALLEAATGIRVSRLPELSDEAKGCADVLRAAAGGGPSRAAFAAALEALLADENLGRPWRGVPECARAAARRAPVLRVPAHHFVFHGTRGGGGGGGGGGCCTVSEYARRCVDAAPGNVTARAAYGEYLLRFCRLLREEVVVPRLIAAVLSGTDALGRVSEGGLLEDAQTVFEWLKARDGGSPTPTAHGPEPAAIPADCRDVRHWLYDPESDFTHFNAAAARRLLAVTCVLKPLPGGHGGGRH